MASARASWRGALVALLTGSRIGLCPPRLWAGLRWGFRPGRRGDRDRGDGAGARGAAVDVRAAVAAFGTGLVGLQIPVGTVWAEEAAFRAALATAAARGFGKSGAGWCRPSRSGSPTSPTRVPRASR
ncbi:putative caax amino protease [Mycobacterium xenopi 4042]|uniref:Putative caax amino protease n=1 Tax=Mycobacterium xenopi 4042 TaxID=1299334 RepID=X7ZWL3_MYCXE|nr:putative caax amino protease [Mycobacterium xenopi 4042]